MSAYAAKGINVSCRTIGGEAFIFDHETRTLLKLDKVGSYIWDQINGMRTVDEIVTICYQYFEGDREVIASAIREFVFDLESRNVVVLSSNAFDGVMISAC